MILGNHMIWLDIVGFFEETMQLSLDLFETLSCELTCLGCSDSAKKSPNSPP